MNAQIELIEGTNRNHAQSQFFTPPKLAAKLVEWANVHPTGWDRELRPAGDMFVSAHTVPAPMRVLEPSAGNGAIVRPLVAAGAIVSAVELDARYRDALCDLLPPPDHKVWCGDNFLDIPACGEVGPYDLVCGNFPFHLDLTGEFTLHALKFAPRVVAIYPSNVFYSEQREDLWKQVRPTRIAFMSKRAWPGATDYVALELERSCPDGYGRVMPSAEDVRVEWWHEAWY